MWSRPTLPRGISVLPCLPTSGSLRLISSFLRCALCHTNGSLEPFVSGTASFQQPYKGQSEVGAGGAGEGVYFRDAVIQRASERAREGRETGSVALLTSVLLGVE